MLLFYFIIIHIGKFNVLELKKKYEKYLIKIWLDFGKYYDYFMQITSSYKLMTWKIDLQFIGVLVIKRNSNL